MHTASQQGVEAWQEQGQRSSNHRQHAGMCGTAPASHMPGLNGQLAAHNCCCCCLLQENGVKPEYGLAEAGTGQAQAAG